jgi:NDP-sugar pyrophosphorylase family protein
MKAMILAAGFGTRLRPLTYSIPKPMVPVCNRPLIGYAVEAFIRAGVNEIVVNLHHLPKAIEKYLQSEYGNKVKFHFSFEQEILGTGGGVRKVRSILEKEEEFFLVNGDTIQSPPYDELRRARREKDSLAALTLRHPPEGDRFTAVYFDNGVITGFGRGKGEPLMFSGSHLISTRIFKLLPDKEFSGIVDEVYQPAIANSSDIITGVIDDGPWFDIGTPHRYIAAAEGVLDLTLEGKLPVVEGSKISGDSIVHTTATMMGKATRSSIGKRSTVKGDIRNSIISAHCQITRSAVVESCILGEGVEINHPIELRSAVVCRDDDAIPRDPSYRYENGLVIAPF